MLAKRILQEAMSVGFSGVSKTVYAKGLLNRYRHTVITLAMALENQSLKSAFGGYTPQATAILSAGVRFYHATITLLKPVY